MNNQSKKHSEMPFKNRDWFRDSSPHTHTHPSPHTVNLLPLPTISELCYLSQKVAEDGGGEMPCEPVICQHHSVWHVSGKKITLEWCCHFFGQSNVDALVLSSLKLCHCQYYHSWWYFKLVFTRGLKFRNAKWFPMTVVTVHCRKLEQESQPLTITVNCESPVNFPVFTGFWMPIQYSCPCTSNWRSLSVYTSFLQSLAFYRSQ